MKPLNALVVVVLVFIFSSNMINQARAESLELFVENTPKKESNSVWKRDGSLVIIDNAEDSGYVIKDLSLIHI